MLMNVDCVFFFFFKQKTAYEMRISDWSSDVCSSDLSVKGELANSAVATGCNARLTRNFFTMSASEAKSRFTCTVQVLSIMRSEEHTSELQSLMRISYAVFCLT